MMKYIALPLFMVLAVPVAETQLSMGTLEPIIFGTLPTKSSPLCSTPAGNLGVCILNGRCQEYGRNTATSVAYIKADKQRSTKCPMSDQICCPYKIRQPPGEDVIRRFRTRKDPPINYLAEQEVSKEETKEETMGAISCGIWDSESGETTPWLVIIKDPSKIWKSTNPYEGSVGGGSLIHPSVVLTAAHVVYTRLELQALAGTGDHAQTRDVDSMIVHENFNSQNVHNDIALLFLAEPFSPQVRVACLPRVGAVPPARCLATEWTNSPQSGQAGFKTVDVPVLSHQQCQSHYRLTRLGIHFILDKSFLCAGGEQRRDVCKGDGGFPLVCALEDGKRFAQFGVIAWDIECGKNAPTVHVDVPAMRAWIDLQVESRGLSTGVYTY